MKKRFVLVLFFVMFTAVFTLFLSPAPTQAASGDLEARWFVEMAFPNDKPVASMTVEIYHQIRGRAPLIMMSKTYPVTCQEMGSVEISNEVAVFDGNGYFECTMPNFKDEVLALTDGKLEMPDNCTCKLAYGIADFMSSAPAGNPIFTMPELQFAVPVQAIGSANYQLSVNGAVAESESFTTTGNMQTGNGRFLQYGSGFAPEFSVDGTNLSSHPAYLAGPLEVPTDQTLFYVGFNPDNGEFLVGKLGGFEVDPGCVGHGGI